MCQVKQPAALMSIQDMVWVDGSTAWSGVAACNDAPTSHNYFWDLQGLVGGP